MLKTVSSITNAIGALNYKGTWNASTNTPTITSSVGTKGDYYVVSVAGTTAIDGISNWGVGDWIVFNGSTWQRVEGGADLNGVNVTFTGTASGPSYETSNATAGLTITNNDITADGTDTNIDIDLIPKGTGGVTFPAGAVGTPSVTTSGDTNTGIYFPAADEVAIVVGGAEKTRVTSTGVGVNLTAPQFPFDSRGIAGVQKLQFTEGSSGSDKNLIIYGSRGSSIINNGGTITFDFDAPDLNVYAIRVSAVAYRTAPAVDYREVLITFFANGGVNNKTVTSVTTVGSGASFGMDVAQVSGSTYRITITNNFGVQLFYTTYKIEGMGSSITFV